jgi:hypothetical protein
MQPHAHIALCDKSWFFYYDYINFDRTASVQQYLDFIFLNFQPENIDRQGVEAEIYNRLDAKNGNPIYFLIGDYVFLWISCTGCRMVGLN